MKLNLRRCSRLPIYFGGRLRRHQRSRRKWMSDANLAAEPYPQSRRRSFRRRAHIGRRDRPRRVPDQNPDVRSRASGVRLGCVRRVARATTGAAVDCLAAPASRFPFCRSGSEKRSSIRRSAHAPSHRHKRGTTWSSSAFHALQIHYGQRPTSGAEPLSWVLPAGFVRRHCHRRIGGRPPCVKSNRTRSQERTRN
jgi:hypothetical protein